MGEKEKEGWQKDFPMVTKFQESFRQTDWGVPKSKSPTGGILPYRERGHISSPVYLVILWERPTRSMVSGKYDGWSRGAFPEAVSQWPAPNRRSDPCVFMATIMSILLQHFILPQINRLTKSLTLIYLKHRWYQRVINFFHKLLLSTYYVSGTMPAAIDRKVIKTQ